MGARGMILDRLGRELRDLRISITDRCNFRCAFCMPEGQDYEFFRREEILSFEEITKFVKAIIPLGIKKVRLTGGEPLLRRDLERLIKMLSELPMEDLSLTTNGFLLKEKAKALKHAGLKRITVSLPSLRDEVFSKLVGREVKVSHILEGIEEALRVGLKLVKVNVCVVRGLNHEEVRYGMLMMVLCDREGRVYDVWISVGSMHEVRACRERKKRSLWVRGLVENCVVYGDRGYRGCEGVIVCDSKDMRAKRQVVEGVISQIKLFNAGSGWRTLTCVLVYVYAYAIGYSYYRRGELEV